jgi:hypothetical protein
METAIYPQKMWRLVAIMMIVCISPFFVGASIFLSASASFNVYKKILWYSIRGDLELQYDQWSSALRRNGWFNDFTICDEVY